MRRLFVNTYGQVHDAWYGAAFVLGVLAGCAALLAVILFGVAKPILEAGCNNAVERIGSPKIADGDYDLLADTCYVTLDDGSTIPIGNHITHEQKDVID